MVNIVLHAILFQPFEYEGVYICPSEMLRMMSCANIAIQIPKTYILLPPVLCFIAASAQAKITFKVRQGFLPA